MAGTALENYSMNKQFAEQGLIANPSDFTLCNNLAFALINLGNIQRGIEALSRASRLQISDQDRVVFQATRGLLAFRTGDVAVGRQLYLDARSKARKMQDSRRFALASAYHAIEEISRGISDGSSVLQEALQALRRETKTDPTLKVLENRLSKMIIPTSQNKNTKNRQ